MTATPDFRALFEALPENVLVLAPDAPRFTILGASDACIATYPGDMAVALSALDATVEIHSAKGDKRTVPVRDFSPSTRTSIAGLAPSQSSACGPSTAAPAAESGVAAAIRPTIRDINFDMTSILLEAIGPGRVDARAIFASMRLTDWS